MNLHTKMDLTYHPPFSAYVPEYRSFFSDDSQIRFLRSQPSFIQIQLGHSSLRRSRFSHRRGEYHEQLNVSALSEVEYAIKIRRNAQVCLFAFLLIFIEAALTGLQLFSTSLRHILFMASQGVLTGCDEDSCGARVDLKLAATRIAAVPDVDSYQLHLSMKSNMVFQ